MFGCWNQQFVKNREVTKNDKIENKGKDVKICKIDMRVYQIDA